MSAERSQADRRVLLLAPTSRDAEASRRLLGSAGIECTLFADLTDLCREITAGAAAVIVPEEVVLEDDFDRLANALKRQPVWSDLPIVILSRSGVESPAVGRALATLGNVSVVERPARVTTLLSVVRAAVRARERQYQVRDHLEEREHTEQAIREARDAAEAASRAKDQFLAMLSHELRTPLSPVVMTVASLQEDPRLPRDAREHLAMVQRNVELETKLIDDLLDVSRVTSGKLRMRMEPVSLHEVVRDALEVCASDINTKRLQMITELSARAERVNGDAARLRQVVWNLLKNAIKFTGDGDRITVRTENLDAAGRVRLSVKDSGVGIATGVLPRLFDAFQQGDPAIAKQFGGLGLGLAIAKAVVDLHGGDIRAESEGAGRGATFIVELNTLVAPQTVTPAATPKPAERRESRKSLRVLLVEDHVDTARALSRLLTLSGHRVRTAGSVAAALELADAERFDILLSDIGLPDATGYDLMERVREAHGLKGIALTGYGMEADMQRGRDVGFADYIIKPVNVAQLETAMDRVVSDDAPVPVR